MARYARRDLTPDLARLTLDQAIEQLRALDEKFQLIPEAAHDTVHAAIEAIATASRDLGLTKLDEIVKHHTKVIAAASGIPQAHHAKFHPAAAAEVLHLHRNALLTLALASVCGHDGDVSPLAEAFPTYHRRTAQNGRPHTDDEIVLLRVFALHQSTGDKNHRRASAVFAMCDTGLLPLDTTQVKTDDLLLVSNDEGMLSRPRVKEGRNRDLTTTRFANTLLRRYLQGVAPGDIGTWLTYRPRKAYDAEVALSSVDGILKRMRTTLGLKHPDTTATSIWKWRADYTLRTLGTDAALEVSGLGSKDALLDHLRLDTTPRATTTETRKPNTFTLGD